MASEEATPLEVLFEKLNQCIKNQQHKKALKACDESETPLHYQPSDPSVLVAAYATAWAALLIFPGCCCGAVLAISPGDEDALRCKVAAYMQLSEFELALALIAKPPLAGLPMGLEKVGPGLE